MRNDKKILVADSTRNISLIKNAREQELRHNSVREAANNQYTGNCAQISALYNDSVIQGMLIKELSKYVLSLQHNRPKRTPTPS